MRNLDLDDYFPQYEGGRETKNFALLSACVISLFFLGGYLLSKVQILPPDLQERITTIRTSFSMERQERPPPPPPPPPKDPIDLTRRQRQETREIPRELSQTPPERKPEQRQVFGLQKVFTTGLGASGAMSDAVVQKFGNTIDTDFDTLTATRDDLLSRVVPASSVTQAPTFRRRVLPVISDEIRRSGVSGTVRVRVLVDIDGKVKRAEAQNDLGFGTAQAAVDACLQMEFAPARIGEQAVAVWITVPVRFEKL